MTAREASKKGRTVITFVTGLLVGGAATIVLMLPLLAPPGLRKPPFPIPVPAGTAWRYATADAVAQGDFEVTGTLLFSKLPTISEAAAYAIRNSDPTDQTVTLLAKALDIPNRKVQYHGMLGLYEAAWAAGLREHLPKAPAVTLYEERPDEYLAPWRSWWAEYHEALLHEVRSRHIRKEPRANPHDGANWLRAS